MEHQQRLDRGEGERDPKEVEHFVLRKRVTWMMATRSAVFFPPSSEGGTSGVYGRRRPPEAPRTEG